jgi:hypothetical protein
MRARNVLTRLAAVAPDAESLFDAGEEDRILQRILASPRRATTRRRPLLLVPVGVAALAVAAAAAAFGSGVFNRATTHTAKTEGHGHVALTGSKIQMAGYRFRTPAGFKASSVSCVAASSSSSGPVTVMNGFSAAASADGGCIEAFGMQSNSGTPAQNGAEPVAVGPYQGYYVPPDASGESTLYIQIPAADSDSNYLALFAEGLTEQQLIEIAQSGLPPNP